MQRLFWSGSQYESSLPLPGYANCAIRYMRSIAPMRLKIRRPLCPVQPLPVRRINRRDLYGMFPLSNKMVYNQEVEHDEVCAFALWNRAGRAALGRDDGGGPRPAIRAGRSLV